MPASLPDFDANGNLPPGIYRVSLAQIEERFARNARRKSLFRGLARAVDSLASAGVKRIWVDGSFVTAKETPEDVDGCWEYNREVEVEKLDPVFLETRPPREAMKRKYGVDFLIAAMALGDAGGRHVEDFFQEDRDGNRKGILVVETGWLR